MKEVYDVIIIGSGPAGLTAAIYAERAKLKTLVLEKNPMSGGQVLTTYEVDNYPGLQGINGFEMGQKFREHAEQLGSNFSEEEVLRIVPGEDVKEIVTKENHYYTKCIVAAGGAHHRVLGVEGEEKFTGMGVSYCATCDGAFFKDKVTAVVGGGDVAAEDAIYLSRICKKVYLIHRRDKLRAAKRLQDQLFSTENIELLWNSQIKKISGQDNVEEILIETEGETRPIAVDGIFIAVGILPETKLYQDVVDMNEQGYIIAGEDCKTSIPGIFAAGDIRTKTLRQIITAASDGANAIASVEEFLNGLVENNSAS